MQSRRDPVCDTVGAVWLLKMFFNMSLFRYVLLRLQHGCHQRTAELYWSLYCRVSQGKRYLIDLSSNYHRYYQQYFEFIVEFHKERDIWLSFQAIIKDIISNILKFYTLYSFFRSVYFLMTYSVAFRSVFFKAFFLMKNNYHSLVNYSTYKQLCPPGQSQLAPCKHRHRHE